MNIKNLSLLMMLCIVVGFASQCTAEVKASGFAGSTYRFNADDSSDGRLSDAENVDVPDFEPTEDWQPILPGQSVPRGVHVRLNMQTGAREGKWADNRHRDEIAAPTTETNPEGGPVGDSERSSATTTASHHDHPPNNQFAVVADSQQQPTSISDLTMEMIDEILSRAEFLQMKECAKNLSDPQTARDGRLDALHHLQGLLHSMDNTLDLHKVDGIRILLNHAAHSPHDDEIRVAALWALGTAAQNTAAVQARMHAAGVLDFVANVLRNASEPDSVRSKAFFTLSALVRGNSILSEHFLTAAGAEEVTGDVLLSQVFQQGKLDMKIRVVHLLGDMLIALKSAENNDNNENNESNETSTTLLSRWVERVRANDFCLRSVSLLDHCTALASVESLVHSLRHLSDIACTDPATRAIVRRALVREVGRWTTVLDGEMKELVATKARGANVASLTIEMVDVDVDVDGESESESEEASSYTAEVIALINEFISTLDANVVQ